MRIHKEGIPYIVIFALLTIVSFVLGWKYIGLLLLLVCYRCVRFFRNPIRVAPHIRNAVLSPADGIVVAITNCHPPKELSISDCNMVRISIFLSLYDVHVNHIPVTGQIIETFHKHGKFLNASLDKASENNERNSIVIETENNTKVACVQIAGFIARRIVSNVSVGSCVVAGEEYGIIKFGSRVDIYLEQSVSINVTIGQTMVSGETIVAHMN